MPGEENIPQSEMHVFDVKSKTARHGQGRPLPRSDRQYRHQAAAPAWQAPGRGGGGGPADRDAAAPAGVAERLVGQAVLHAPEPRQHRLDVCVADTATGEVKTLIEERLNTYVESKPLRLAGNGTELIFWSERDGWGHFYLYDAATGALKNRITEGEFVATSHRERGRQGARRCTSRPAAARRARTRTTRTSIASASTAPASSCSTRATRRTPCRSPNRRGTS